MDFAGFVVPLILLTAFVEQVAAEETISFSTAIEKYASKLHRTSASEPHVQPNARTFVASLTPAGFGRFGWETWQLNIGLGTPGKLTVFAPVLHAVSSVFP